MAYVSHFCTRFPPSRTPLTPIDFIKNSPKERYGRGSWDTYWVVGGIGAALIALILTTALLPSRAAAFWPFSIAAAAGTPAPLVHNPSMGLLQAATNPDPNPTKNDGAIALSSGSALLAESGPDGTLADVAGATTDQISLYVVREGDSLADISKMFGVSVNTIVWANNLGSARTIHPGQQLLILPVSGVSHTILKNETLASLAKNFHGDAGEIAEFNGLDPNAPLKIGTKVIIPGGELAVVVAPVKKKTTIPANPFRGGDGAELDGYYGNPVPGAILTQGLHGWNGVDLGSPKGSPIYAAAEGSVIVSRSNGAWNGGFGNYVVITHPNGTQTLYAHMTKAIVTLGQSVARGQVIGYVGATGLATGPHVHFEVRGAKNPFADCPVGRSCQPQ